MPLKNIEDSLESIAWKTSGTDPSGPVKMKLQVDKIPGLRNFKRIVREMESEGWSVVGEGLNAKNQNFMILCARSFPSYSGWVSWAKGYPYRLQEISPTTDRPKRIKLGKGSQLRPGRPRKEK